MSRDLLVNNASEETATTSPSHRDRVSGRPRAAALVEKLLADVQRDWTMARPHTESLWQLAGE
jgi:hypothetical protein